MPEAISAVTGGEFTQESAQESAHAPAAVEQEEAGLRRGPVADRIRAGLNALDWAFRAILVMALVIQLAIVLTGIVSRFWFDESLLWADEAARSEEHTSELQSPC